MSYAQLPYTYVISAVTNYALLNRRKLHDLERPIALLTSVYAMSQRDPKKRDKSMSYEDFSFYKPLDGDNISEGHNSSAYMELIRLKMLPQWALFCYKKLSSTANSGYVPSEPGFIAEDAILLHPVKIGEGRYRGLLLATESASLQIRTFRSTKGEEFKFRVPLIETKVVAIENEVLNF